MSVACLMIGQTLLQLATGGFTLSWVHSVERTEWRESWQVTDTGLQLQSSAIRGSGAGMEPGEDAEYRDGWWVSPGHLSVPRLVLAASGATASGWTLCADGTCQTFGAAPDGPIVLAPCQG